METSHVKKYSQSTKLALYSSARLLGAKFLLMTGGSSVQDNVSLCEGPQDTNNSNVCSFFSNVLFVGVHFENTSGVLMHIVNSLAQSFTQSLKRTELIPTRYKAIDKEGERERKKK